MGFSGEPSIKKFLCPKLSDSVPKKKMVTMCLEEFNMNSESKEYTDLTKGSENNPVGFQNHWDQTNNPNGPHAGPNLDGVASGSGDLEKLRHEVKKENILCFFKLVESELKRVGMAKAAEQFVNRVEAKTPAELEEFKSVILWNLLNMPYQMLFAMVEEGFMDSPAILYVPLVTSSFVIPPPASSGMYPQTALVRPIGTAPFFGETPAFVSNAESLPVSGTESAEICLADNVEDVKVVFESSGICFASQEGVVAEVETEAKAESSGGKRNAGAAVGEADEQSVLKKAKGHTDSAGVSSFETLK